MSRPITAEAFEDDESARWAATASVRPPKKLAHLPICLAGFEPANPVFDFHN
jgi:hypothetical protein